MSNEKMREEFEAWYSEQFKYSDKKLIRHGDTYLSPFVGGIWMSWQASRATMCVELPLAFSDERATTYLTSVTSALDAAGVSYK